MYMKYTRVTLQVQACGACLLCQPCLKLLSHGSFVPIGKILYQLVPRLILNVFRLHYVTSNSSDWLKTVD